MTTVELAHRLLKDGSSRDLSLLDAGDALDLVDAMNAGIQKFFNEAPTAYKRTTISERLAAKRTVSLTITQGSNVVGGSPFLDNERGASVIIDSEAFHNEIVDNNQLLHDIVQSSGTASAEIYHDSLAFTDFSIERMISDPEIVHGGGANLNQPRKLFPDTEYESESDLRDSWYYHFGRQSIGTPRWYRVVYGGMVQNSDVIWILKIYPIPAEALTIKMDVELRPLRYKLAALQTPAVLPIQDEIFESILLPACRGEFAKTHLFGGDANRRSLLIAEGSQALGAAGRIQRSIKRPRRKIRTAAGY